MTRPLIGLSSYREQARWGVWETSADLLPSDYALAIEAAGGTPVLLPPSLPYDGAAASVVARLDGLVITGGADVQPERYGEPAHEKTVVWHEHRDAWELALLDAADQRGLPTVGVCRGMQVMAVHAGGSLEQHVPDVVEHEGHNPGGDAYGDTQVRIDPGSRLAGILGEAPIVACHHHQAVSTHPGFTGVAWAADGLLEAIEAPGERLVIGVQWHPEVTDERGLFRALVEAAVTSGG
ncbi:MAG: peptidase [Marmoricola sp.]|nr:peptidase [Marmoricola sp.]